LLTAAIGRPLDPSAAAQALETFDLLRGQVQMVTLSF
jgi:hypothetical protein